MSVPFIIWTLRRTGGTTLRDLLMDLSDRPRLPHEPFNWDGELGWITRDFHQSKNVPLLRDRLETVLAPGPSLKHAYEVVGSDFSAVLMEAATRAGYRHILLTRADEVGRMLSLELAEMTGHWGDASTAGVYDDIRNGRRALPPIDLPAMLDQMHADRGMTERLEEQFRVQGVDAIRVDFQALYADPEAGRAQILELCDILALGDENIDTLNEKLSDALASKGQNSAGVQTAIPNFAEARRALVIENARLTTHSPRYVMQQCRLPAADQLLLRVEAPLIPGREIYFDDDRGRPLLALICRAERRKGGSVTRLIVNRHEDDGSWGPEVAVDLPDGLLAAPFTLALGWGQFAVRAGDRVLLNLDPIRCFGPESEPGRMVALRSNYDLRLFSVRTGAEVARQLVLSARIAAAAPPAPPLREGVTLIMLARRADLARRRREAESLAGAFAGTIVLDGWTPGTEAADRVIDDALAAVVTRHVMIVSGGWPPERLAETAAMAGAGAAGDAPLFVPLGPDAVYRAGLRWGVMLSTRFAGRPTLTTLAGVVTVDPAFLALAQWRRPAGEASGLDLGLLRQQSARLPFALRRDGTTMLQLAQPTAHPLVVTGGTVIDRALTAAGLQHLPLGTVLPMSVGGLARQVLPLLAQGAAEAVMLVAGDDPAGAAARLSVDPMAEVLAGPPGLRLDAATLAALAGVTDDPAAVDRPHADLPALIAALTDLLRAAGTPVTSAPGWRPLDAPDTAEVEPVWMLPDAVLAEVMQRAASPGAEGAVASLRRLAASPAQFARLVVQAVAVQSPHLVDVVSNLDLEGQGSNRVARMLAILGPTGLLADPDLAALITAQLSRRRYLDEVRTLLATGMRPASPLTRLALITADIAASVFDPADQRFAGPDPARLLPEGLPPGTTLAGFGEALTHYLSARRDWPGVIATVALVGEANITNWSYEHWVMARLGLGLTEGTDRLIVDGRDSWRLHDWSWRRLSMQLAQRSGDTPGLGAALADMLANDPEMAPLAGAPTRFTMLNGTPGVAPGEVACVIVARNEFTRLKWLVDYYRTLGVAQFVLVDNMSTDGTIAHFRDQPDIRILQTAENYRDARFGVKWHNEVCARWFDDRWVLTVDADEVLVFDGSDQPGALRELTARMDAHGEQALTTAMIDMYAEVPLDELVYTPGDSLIEAFPLFDGTGYWFDRTASFPDTTVSGGVRIRRFWNDRHDPRLPYISMQKAPLVRWHKGFRYLSSTHEMTPCRIAAETGALLHFKFLPDFHARALEEVARKQHYDGAREYRVYAEVMKDPANRSFRYPGSLRYEGPDTLVRAGLMTPRGAVGRDGPDGDAARLTA